MCLVKVRQEEDVVVPYRVVQHSRPQSRRHSERYSRTEVRRESPRPSASYVAVPAPKPLAIPAPQPVPVFVEPAPAPPPPLSVHSHSQHHGPHYVEVSPRSSVSSVSDRRSDYVVHEREYRRRERDYSPASSSPRYEHFRYVEPPPSESDHFERFERRRSRSRVRERSVSRGPEYRYGGGGRDYGERVTRERITIVDDDGRRRREYRH